MHILTELQMSGLKKYIHPKPNILIREHASGITTISLNCYYYNYLPLLATFHKATIKIWSTNILALSVA